MLILNCTLHAVETTILYLPEYKTKFPTLACGNQGVSSVHIPKIHTTTVKTFSSLLNSTIINRESYQNSKANLHLGGECTGTVLLQI
jgi:hypothetical protein